MNTTRRRYSAEFKFQVALDAAKGQPYTKYWSGYPQRRRILPDHNRDDHIEGDTPHSDAS